MGSYWWHRIRHWLLAGNAHGLHSPFVYHLYTTVLRPKTETLSSQAQWPWLEDLGLPTDWTKVVGRLLAHWQPVTIWMFSQSGIETINAYPAVLDELERKIRQMVIVVDGQCAETQSLLTSVEPSTCILIIRPYSTAANQNLWQQLVQSPRMTATVDIFWIGLAFPRSKQAKEAFTLR